MAHVIDYIEFAVDDLEQSKAFYTKALGWGFNDYGADYAGIKDPTTGKVQTFTGWRDPNYKPPPGATPFPDCWSSALSDGGSASPAASLPPGTTSINETAQNTAFLQTALIAPADKPFAIVFENQDASVPHNIEIKNSAGADAFKGEIFPGVATKTYAVPALKAGTYPFQCTVHPNMTGTLTVK